MNRVVILDLLRFVAAFSVVLFHYTFSGYMMNQLSLTYFQQIGYIFQYGNMGVELFFMISGFVILLSTESKSSSHFVISRLTRLYPAYWVGVTLTALVIMIYGGNNFSVTIYQYLVNLTMISEVFHVKYIDGVYWTLFVEIRFYFLIFLLMIFNQMSFLKFYLLIWAAISILYHFIDINGYISFFLILNVAPFFISGCIFFITYKNNKFDIIDYVILLLSFISSIMYLNYEFSRLEKLFIHEFNITIIITILISFYFIFFAISKRVVFIQKEKKIYKLMGNVTYPLYLIHAYIGYIIFNNLYGTINKYLLLLLIIMLMVFLSYLIHTIFERRLGKYMKVKLFQIIDAFIFRFKN